ARAFLTHWSQVPQRDLLSVAVNFCSSGDHREHYWADGSSPAGRAKRSSRQTNLELMMGLHSSILVGAAR
ncbi:MAG TPA: hypothetical protein VIV60_31145, partial [Polyangiaceae bacterium]